MNKKEKERVNYCTKTLSMRHMWQITTIGQRPHEYTPQTLEEAKTNNYPLVRYVEDIIKPKCLACGIVNDLNEEVSTKSPAVKQG